MLKFIKNFFQKSKDSEKESVSGKIAEDIKEKTDKLIDFVTGGIENLKTEFDEIKSKYDNLLETNYDLGLKHLENGKIPEAIFRFRFIKRIWPDSYRSYYYLAYALTLKGGKKSFLEAKEILETLLEKSPSSISKAQDLLQEINNRLENPFHD